jgi:hypothetical protein
MWHPLRSSRERVTTAVSPIVHLIAARLEDHSSLLGA